MNRSNALLIGILSGIVAGVVTGWLWGEGAVAVLPLGTFFLNALKMIVVPLVVVSMISGVTSLGDVRRVGKTGAYTIVYYTATTGIAVLIGLVLVNITQPGAGIDVLNAEIPERLAGKSADPWQILLSLVHPSLVGAAADLQVLPLLVFSILFGAALTTIGERGRVAIDFFEAANSAIMKVVDVILWIAPIGVFGLVAGQLGKHGGLTGFLPVLKGLAVYAGTVVGGLAIHAFVVLPLILWFVAKRAPHVYGRRALTPLGTAFSTASSSATLPVTLETTIVENRVSPAAARFVLPLGATINMDGTALYEAVAALFIAQAYGIELTLWQQVIVLLTATLAAVGAAGIPEAGLVTMVIVLTAVGLPLEGVSLILAIDWFLDRCRTTVNVWGDMVGAAVVAELRPGETHATDAEVEEHRSVKVRKAVIPVAGLGTRMLPASKVIPKELVTIVDRPSVQWVVEAARDSGIEHVIFVTASGKSAIEDHFDRQPWLEQQLERGGKSELLERIRSISQGLTIASVRQAEPLGLGHAVLMARDLVGDEPFAVILPDELVVGERPALAQCLETAQATECPVLGLVRVPREDVRRYGMVAVRERDERTFEIRDLVEKPDPADSPSDMAISGPYVLVPEVFDAIAAAGQGASGEIQLTDALRTLTGTDRPLLGRLIEGERLDVGQPLGFVQANIALGLAHPQWGPALRAWLDERRG